MGKRIQTRHLDGPWTYSQLDYEKEIKRMARLIKKLQLELPELSDDEAYETIRNYFSSYTSYRIVGSDKDRP